MVRLADLPEWERQHLLGKIPTLKKFAIRPWVSGAPLTQRRVALITTAGLHLRTDNAFTSDSANDYRVIPGDVAAADLVMSQFSVNFDRSGFQRDVNVVFPIDRLKEIVAKGVVGSAADFHYSFMGAGSTIEKYEGRARELAGLLKKDAVDAVLLTPV
jgi:D-proline reductase (dithiol) PrdB